MSSVLESVEWGKHALDILKHTKDLDQNLPAVMHIRHSERPSVTQRQKGFTLPLTKRGEETSYEFGLKLPVNRKYYFHHTDINRTLNTAENIMKGILYNQGESKIVGEIPIASVVDVDEASKYMMPLMRQNDSEGARTFYYRWICGVYPPWVMTPSLDFAQQGASYMMKKLKKSESHDLHILVSHENWIAAFLHHWLGECSFHWIPFMDGFILQLYDDYMVLFFRGEKKQVDYPYWWNF